MLLILIKLAWKNILRNKRRTIIAAAAISIGLAALIFVDAYTIGVTNNMVKTATASFLEMHKYTDKVFEMNKR